MQRIGRPLLFTYKKIKAMAKLTKAQLAARGREIMRKAKEVRKAHPGMKWQNCVKMAAKKK